LRISKRLSNGLDRFRQTTKQRATLLHIPSSAFIRNRSFVERYEAVFHKEIVITNFNVRRQIMNLQGILNETINQDTISNMSQTLGADEGSVSTAIQAALPMLVGALARNSSSQEGALSLDNALANDHDGSVLGNLGDLIGMLGGGQGGGILGHIFGNKQPAVEEGISQHSGLDMATVGKLLMMLAPIVMGALGKAKREQGLDASGVAGMLENERQQHESNASPMVGMLSQLLDQDHDGSAVDDIFRMVGGMMNKRS
jgi:hypothetical protein